MQSHLASTSSRSLINHLLALQQSVHLAGQPQASGRTQSARKPLISTRCVGRARAQLFSIHPLVKAWSEYVLCTSSPHLALYLLPIGAGLGDQLLGADLGSRAAAEQHLGPEPLELGPFFTETGSVSSSGTSQDTLLAGNRVVFSIEPRDVSPWSGAFPVLEAVLSPYDCTQAIVRDERTLVCFSVILSFPSVLNRGFALQEAAGEKRSISEVSSALGVVTHGRVVPRGKA
ncbi:unnamed protein product [Boreogadus saida]